MTSVYKSEWKHEMKMKPTKNNPKLNAPFDVAKVRNVAWNVLNKKLI